MTSLKVQIIIQWAAVTFYALGTILFIASFVFKKEKYTAWGTWMAVLGFIPATLAIVFRWIQSGRFPMWGIYEVFPNYAWGAVLFYIVVAIWKPDFRLTGGLILPFSFLMIGISVMGSKEVAEIPRSFQTYWLGVHVSFAKVAYGSALVSAGLGILNLIKLRAEQSGNISPFLEKLPAVNRLNHYSYRFAVFAFIMLGIMIASGSIWAYKAWGRYWGWDPIETWALISWLVYGLSFHLRLVMGWKDKRWAWLSIFALIIVVFAFFGIPIFYDSVHEHLKYKNT